MFGTAHATRSRMNSLGQNENQGSFYLMDNRNFFRNPANAAKMRNYMVAELGTAYKDADGAEVVGSLEGGYFGEFNSDMAFGAYLGKAAVVNELAGAMDATPIFVTSKNANPFNLFLGGGSDMKWGINLGFAMTDKEINGIATGTKDGKAKYNALSLAAGIETSGGLQVYASYGTEESDGANASATTPSWVSDKIESAPFTVGLIYSLNAETTVFVQYSMADVDYTDTTGKTTDEASQMVLGIGRIYELSPTARFNFDLSYNAAEWKEQGGTKTEKQTLPLVIGLEADAAEWLILRASVRQNFILGDYKVAGVSDKSSLSGTKVALGATLHFGKLKIDGNLGGFGGQDNTNLFTASDMFVNAGVTYMF